MSDVAVTQRPRQRIRDLARCAHPKQAVGIALAMGVSAAIADRPTTEVLLVGAAVLAVQLSLGFSNDLCDAAHDLRAETPGKPIAAGKVDPSSASYWMSVLVLLSVPLAVSSGIVAGIALLITLPVGWVHNRWLHRTRASFLGWLVTFGLYPAFLAYGGYGGGMHGSAPTWQITVAAAALGVSLHFATSLGDLVTDNKSGAMTLPLRVAIRIGAPRLLFLTIVATGLATAGLVGAAGSVGLRQ